MGDFRIIIDAIGGHGQDRGKKDGEVVNFSSDSENSPEALAQEFIKKMQANGVSVIRARVIHWPADNHPDVRESGAEIVDSLLTGIRHGRF